MESKTIGVNVLKIAMPLLLGGLILYWMYRDFDFQTVGHVMLHEMDWTWMLLSFPFGTDDARMAVETDAGAIR